jgi:hypothetical protein
LQEHLPQSAVEVTRILFACCGRLGRVSQRRPRFRQGIRQRRITISIALRTSLMAPVNSLAEVSQQSSRRIITVKRKGFLNRLTSLRILAAGALAQALFQPVLACLALGIIAMHPSPEYLLHNRTQQSPHCNQFFRCAPFNCDYTQR